MNEDNIFTNSGVSNTAIIFNGKTGSDNEVTINIGRIIIYRTKKTKFESLLYSLKGIVYNVYVILCFNRGLYVKI